MASETEINDKIWDFVKMAEDVAFECGYQKAREDLIPRYVRASIENHDLGYAEGVKAFYNRLQTILLCDDQFDPTDATVILSKMDYISEQLSKGGGNESIC